MPDFYITLQCVSVSEEWKFGNAQALKLSLSCTLFGYSVNCKLSLAP